MYMVMAQVGRGVLFCSTPQAPLYAPEVLTPFVAVDVGLYSQGWQCGDKLLIEGPGWQLEALALDAGPLDGFYVLQPEGHLEPIVVDIPKQWAPFEGLSNGPVEVHNLSLTEGPNQSSEVRP